MDVFHTQKSMLIYIIIVIQPSSFITFILNSTDLVFQHNFIRFKSLKSLFVILSPVIVVI